MAKHGARYLQEKLIPGFHMGICTSRKQFKRECKSIGPRADGLEFIPAGDAACTYTFEDHEGSGTWVLVCIDKDQCSEYSQAQVGAIVAHECLHALNSLIDHVGVCSSQDHFAVYYFQAMVEHCLDQLWE